MSSKLLRDHYCPGYTPDEPGCYMPKRKVVKSLGLLGGEPIVEEC